MYCKLYFNARLFLVHLGEVFLLYSNVDFCTMLLFVLEKQSIERFEVNLFLKKIKAKLLAI